MKTNFLKSTLLAITLIASLPTTGSADEPVTRCLDDISGFSCGAMCTTEVPLGEGNVATCVTALGVECDLGACIVTRDRNITPEWIERHCLTPADLTNNLIGAVCGIFN